MLMARKKKSIVAAEDQHYRHRLDAAGKHVFVCIAGEHKPRSYSSFAAFQTHMHNTHNLALAEELLERGKPWLPSKSDFSMRMSKPRKVAPARSAKGVKEVSWTRLRSTVALRWRMCKTRKKSLLKQKYFVASDEPYVPAKSVLVRLLRHFIFTGVFGRNWTCLLDPNMYDMCNEYISSAGVSHVVGKWASDLQQLPIQLPRDRKLQALQMDCHLLQCTFPKPGEQIPASEVQHVKEFRDIVIQDALQYLEAKQEAVKWQQYPKEVDFEGAYEDYRQWKADHKQRSISKATTNLLAGYVARGLTEAAAREAAGLNEAWEEDTSDGSDYEVEPGKWGLGTHDSDQDEDDAEVDDKVETPARTTASAPAAPAPAPAPAPSTTNTHQNPRPRRQGNPNARETTPVTPAALATPAAPAAQHQAPPHTARALSTSRGVTKRKAGKTHSPEATRPPAAASATVPPAAVTATVPAPQAPATGPVPATAAPSTATAAPTTRGGGRRRNAKPNVVQTSPPAPVAPATATTPPAPSTSRVQRKRHVKTKAVPAPPLTHAPAPAPTPAPAPSPSPTPTPAPPVPPTQHKKNPGTTATTNLLQPDTSCISGRKNTPSTFESESHGLSIICTLSPR